MTRTFSMIAVALALGVMSARGDESNADCIERLRLPEYAPLARLAKVTGALRTMITLDSAGKPGQIRTEYSGPLSRGAGVLLEPNAKLAIQSSTFAARCAGMTVTVIFEFVVQGTESSRPTPTYSVGYPHRFWIVTSPAPLTVEQSHVSKDQSPR